MGKFDVNQPADPQSREVRNNQRSEIESSREQEMKRPSNTTGEGETSRPARSISPDGSAKEAKILDELN